MAHFPDCIVGESGEVLLCHCPVVVDKAGHATRRRPAPLRVRTDSLPPPVEVVRELPGPGALVAAVRCILLTVLAGLLAFACGALTGCDNGGASHAGTSQGERIYLATEAAWYGRGDLPPINDEIADCERLPLLELLTPVTLAEYEDHCPKNSWACLRWQPLDGRVRNLKYPVAYMNPMLAADRWPAHGVHEITHSFMECADLGSDYFHKRPGVWRPDPTSVEAVAVKAIYEPAE